MPITKKTKEERAADSAAKYREDTPLGASPKVGDIEDALAGIKQRAAERKSFKDKANQEAEAKRVERSRVKSPSTAGGRLHGLASFSDRTKVT